MFQNIFHEYQIRSKLVISYFAWTTKTTAPMKKYNTPLPMPALTNHLTALFKTLLKTILFTKSTEKFNNTDKKLESCFEQVYDRF
jgi:hypothetical protein